MTSYVLNMVLNYLDFELYTKMFLPCSLAGEKKLVVQMVKLGGLGILLLIWVQTKIRTMPYFLKCPVFPSTYASLVT